jgi:DNA-binding response OmpR family regulator
MTSCVPGAPRASADPREFDFLAYLARDPGKVCARRMIEQNVWVRNTGTADS